MTPHPPAPLRAVSGEHRHEPADYELEPNELAAEAIRRVWQEYDLPVGPTMFRKMADAALTALTQAPRSCWQPIETAPADEPILAAIEVQNNKTGAGWWERHVIVIDSETGNVTSDTDAGWSAGDYTHWQPLPEPPANQEQQP